MRIKSNKLIANSLFTPYDFIPADNVEKNQHQIKRDIASSRKHLELLRTKIYKTIDASGSNASVYRLNEASDDDGVNYTIRPSEFLIKAYATQTFDKQGEGIENRDQSYINAGKSFDAYCKKHANTLDSKKTLFDDVGKMIAAINGALSMLNKIEANLIKAQADSNEYELVGGLLPQIPQYINLVLKEAKESKIIKLIPEQTIVRQTLSSLSDIVRSLKKFFSHLGQSEDDRYNNRFKKLERKYDNVDKKNDDEMTEDDISDPDSPAPN